MNRSAFAAAVVAVLASWSHAGCTEPVPELAIDGGTGETPDAPPGGGSFDPDVIAVVVTAADGQAPKKGDRLHLLLTVQNHGDGAGVVELAPRLTSERFADFTDVPLGSVTATLAANATVEVTLEVGPLLEDPVSHERYALGRGAYMVPGVRLTPAGAAASVDAAYTGAGFTIGASDVVFTAVVYDQAYFDKIGHTGSALDYLAAAFTRPNEVFTPSSPGASNGTYERFEGGFDQMMGIRQIFAAVPGLAASNDAGGFCEQVGGYARTALGLSRDWDADETVGAYTDPDHHGFDILVGLTQAMGGGAACGWLGVQVSGLFDFDLSIDRDQIVLVHEMGHIFGAPHCDPMQGYVMCAGEQHARYQDGGVFVWHRASRDVMQNRWE